MLGQLKNYLFGRLPNDATKYYDGTGVFSVPAGSGSGSITTGDFASLPATCAVGDMYVFTDSVFNFAFCDSTNVWTLYLDGKIAVSPGTVASWTGVNVGSDFTASDITGAINILIDRNASLNWRGLFKTEPATPYTITFQFSATARSTNSSTFGVYFYDGTKLMGIEWLLQAASNTLRVQKITNVTTDNTTPAFIAGPFPVVQSGGFCWFPNLYFRLLNSGATLAFSVSFDNINFFEVFSEAVGTYITPTHYGFGGVNASSIATDDVTINMKSIIIT